MKRARSVAGFLAILISASANASAQPDRHASDVGTVEFNTSCLTTVHESFNQAVALLHSFEYDRARAAFNRIAAQDPTCAMAHWGAAMTYFHGAWGDVDQANGAREAALARDLAQKNPAITPRERQFIQAVSAIYSNPSAAVLERAKEFSAAMAQLHEADPQDVEASIFYALSLFVSAGRDPTYANQRHCGELLEPLFDKLPHHPGVAHYLIHCYDNPALAAKGLRAAREYARIAPDSAHATHMPSHIFVRLGLWQETVQSNLASMAVAAREPAHCHDRDAQLHAMHFLQFAYLQLGRRQEAQRVAENALALPLKEECGSGDFVAASFALQAHDWALARRLGIEINSEDLPDTEVTLTAIGIGAARSGNLERAEAAAAQLAEVSRAATTKIAAGPKSPFEAGRLEVEAWIAWARGKGAQALELIRRAEDAGGYASWAQPTPTEYLGDLLMEQHQPAAALAAYRKALENTPNLFNALYGAARAAEASGDRATAGRYYRTLIEVAGTGDRPEIEAARAAISDHAQNAVSGT